MIPYEWILDAAIRISPYIQRTPISHDDHGLLKDVFFKWENHQVTGSFKARGALNKILSLKKWEVDQGLVTASAGNHGQGVALAGKIVGAKTTVFVSEHGSPSKIEAMRELGAEIRLVKGGYGEAEREALKFAHTEGLIWVSPYNDGQVITGQGTIASEVLDEYPQLDKATWIVPAGGGGLVSGIGAGLSNLPLPPRLVAVQSTVSPFLHSLFYKGTQDKVIELPSLADGLSGPVEENSVTIPLVKKYVDDIILVTEEEIKTAIAVCWQRFHERIEGAAATTLAAILSNKIQARPAVLIISGGNIDTSIFEQILASYASSLVNG